MTKLSAEKIYSQHNFIHYYLKYKYEGARRKHEVDVGDKAFEKLFEFFKKVFFSEYNVLFSIRARSSPTMSCAICPEKSRLITNF